VREKLTSSDVAFGRQDERKFMPRWRPNAQIEGKRGIQLGTPRLPCNPNWRPRLYETAIRSKTEGNIIMKKLTIMLTALALSAGAFAQVTTAVKEGAKATVEKTEQLGDKAKAAVTTGATKQDANAKAEAHKAKAHHHAQKMKDAAKTKDDKKDDSAK
jgi:hypothetical protein